MMNAKDFLLALQDHARVNVTGPPLSDCFPNLLLDVKNEETSPELNFELKKSLPYIKGREMEIVSTHMQNVSGRSVWLQDLPTMDSGEVEKYLQHLRKSKVDQIRELLDLKGHRRILVIRKPPEDPNLARLRSGQQRFLERYTIVLDLSGLMVRVSLGTARYEGTEASLISNNIFFASA